MKYTLADLLRNRWGIMYFSFFLMLTLALLWLSGDVSKVILSLMNIILILCPLIAITFGTMYFYQSREFTELLLAQPIRRTAIFSGQHLGLALSLSLSLGMGLGLPFTIFGLWSSPEMWNGLVLIITGIALSFIFSGLALLIALKNDNQVRGFGLAILVWLFFGVIYDGIVLLLLLVFKDYPLEYFSMLMTLFNPIDLSRIIILLKLDISALMGYTGAVFQKFLGSATGGAVAFSALALWIGVPAWYARRLATRKNF